MKMMRMKKKNEKKYEKPKSNIDFRFMSLLFKFRDKRHPPINKVEKTKIKPGDFVLDYGCGPGSYTIAAAELVGPSGKVYAADIHPLAIKKVDETTLKKRLKNVQTILTDCKTGLSDESIDVIICFDVIHGLADLESILIEFHRVLKRNSSLSVDDHHLSRDEIIAKISEQGLFKYKEEKNEVYTFIKI